MKLALIASIKSFLELPLGFTFFGYAIFIQNDSPHLVAISKKFFASSPF
jgi:hypothetical protein